ncbi:putative oxygenase MesX [Brevibacterium litoralis]|uniref:putative oxygenase MesX n=1 Tax=Brevibacterium litoralis TaxID=3138935 RepID=UPI0032EF7E50
MEEYFRFSVRTTRFDEDYTPSSTSRYTTNFANLARGERRQENLRAVQRMIDERFNALAGALTDVDDADGEHPDRYSVELDIVSVDIHLGDDDAGDGEGSGFPLIEMLDVHVLDRHTGVRTPGITGNNFSSYVRDYDFSVVLPAFKASLSGGSGGPGGSGGGVPEDFGDLHGRLFRAFLRSGAYRERFSDSPVVCISVSTSRTYRRTGFVHPVLGVEYRQDDSSLTDDYFGRMGMEVRYFMPRGSAAPLAFYHCGDLLTGHSDLALIGTISTMEAFQRIYRPEIYNSTVPAGEVFRPRLDNPDHAPTGIVYDREERSRLGMEQGRFAAEHFIRPHREFLDRWMAGTTV